MSFPHLAVWDDATPRAAAWNMAADETLLEWASAHDSPALRLYRWATPAVSFGYFDSFSSIAAQYPEREAIRRWTGGGAVDHQEDATFALAIPRRAPLGAGPALQSYRAIHEGVAAALRSLGFSAELAGSSASAPAGLSPAPCFVRPVCADVMLAARKVAGGAQRRTRLGLLHQGSIQALPAGWRRDDVFAALPSALARACTPLPVAELLERSRELAEQRYATREWNERR